MARQARQGAIGPGTACRGRARPVKAGKARRVVVLQVEAWRVTAGKASRGVARHGLERQVKAGMSRLGEAGLGWSGKG